MLVSEIKEIGYQLFSDVRSVRFSGFEAGSPWPQPIGDIIIPGI
jgi:hypothetical protein